MTDPETYGINAREDMNILLGSILFSKDLKKIYSSDPHSLKKIGFFQGCLYNYSNNRLKSLIEDNTSFQILILYCHPFKNDIIQYIKTKKYDRGDFLKAFDFLYSLMWNLI